ncbi:glutamate racemase [Burkholderia cepacia]|uniref:Glutamate racemase n=1 Tax=Burkholderia cepacia GG4 TaxID=1009846 RepID=A0A9W3P8R5_BURCE|nr:glutamate racemase [Burkholderia cepacia]AFQ47700.1 glutamate racemase [Burkholderia cepacia GG4]
MLHAHALPAVASRSTDPECGRIKPVDMFTEIVNNLASINVPLFRPIHGPTSVQKLMFNGIAPIGIFDSGLGGMSVVEAIRRRLPGEAIVYIADTLYAPYGEKTDEFIRSRSLALAEWLAQRGAKLLVIACNTATTHAISYVRSRLAIPVIGVEPGIKPAVQVSGAKVVGVLATAATLRSHRLQALLSAHGHACRFICQAGHGLVELIEQGEATGSSIEALLDKYLTPMIVDGADTLVLGSTHYALLVPSIKRVFGDRLNLIETATAIARRVDHQLTDHQLHNDVNPSGSVLQLCSTAISAVQRAPLAKLAQMLALDERRVSAIDVETC